MIFDWPREPTWSPMGGRFYLTTLGRKSSSPYSGSTKSITLNRVWMAELAFNNHSLEQAFAIQNFIEGLEGHSNVVRLFDHWRKFPQLTPAAAFTDGTFFSDGTGFIDAPSPLVAAAASKGASSVVLGQLFASQKNFLKGDLIGIGDYLYQVTSDVTANVAGQALVQIAPNLRTGIAIGDAVSSTYATCKMRLIDGGDGIVRSLNTTEGFTLTFVEDVP